MRPIEAVRKVDRLRREAREEGRLIEVKDRSSYEDRLEPGRPLSAIHSCNLRVLAPVIVDKVCVVDVVGCIYLHCGYKEFIHRRC